MTQRQWTAQFVAACLVLGSAAALSGCGTVSLFGEYEVAESPDVEAAPYPRLVDVPDAPPVGVYTEAVPDPAVGAAAQTDLSAAATVADVRAAELARVGPGDAIARAAAADAVADANARAAELARVDPSANERAAAADTLAAATDRAARLAAPVISDSEREAMLARARREQ